jgi:hypothetical protein
LSANLKGDNKMRPAENRAWPKNTVPNSVQRRRMVVRKLAVLEGFALGVLALEPNHERAALDVLAMLDKRGAL